MVLNDARVVDDVRGKCIGAINSSHREERGVGEKRESEVTSLAQRERDARRYEIRAKRGER